MAKKNIAQHELVFFLFFLPSSSSYTHSLSTQINIKTQQQKKSLTYFGCHNAWHVTIGLNILISPALLADDLS